MTYGIDYITYHNGKIYLPLSNGSEIFVTADKGQTWETIYGPPGNPSGNINHLEIVNGIFLLVDGDGEIYRSIDQGGTWSLVLDFWAPGVTYHRLYQIGNRVILEDDDGWFYSTDNGATWNSLIPSGMPILDQFDDAPAPSQLLSMGNLLFAVLRFHGVYISSDFGDTWQTTNVGLGNLRGRVMAANDATIYLGTTQGGIWSRGANFEGVQGMVFNDENANGQQDAGELPLSGIVIESNPLNSYASTNVDGTYTLYAEVLNDTVSAVPPSPYATVIPPFYLVNGTTTDKDFAVYFTPGMDDLCITATALEPIRPGFGTSLMITVSNVGTTDQSPEILLDLPIGINYLSSNPMATSIIGDTVIWQLGLLPAFASVNIVVEIEGDLTLNLGDDLIFQSNVSPIANDQSSINNFHRLVETVVGSYDPNDKQVSPNYLTPEQLELGERLTYTIRFQNTGTYHAENVRIVDTLSEGLDISSLQILASSHQPMDWHIRNGRVLEFVFENILLPDSIADEAGSHGFVKFSIKANNGLELGDQVSNTAHIYFDFNPAIVTNTVVAPISNIIATFEVYPNIQLSVLPNPNSGNFKLSLPETVNGKGCLTILSMDGGLAGYSTVEVNHGQLAEQHFDLPKGLYIVMLELDQKQYFGKMTIQ